MGAGIPIENVSKDLQEKIQHFWEEHEKDNIKMKINWEEVIDAIMKDVSETGEKILFAEDNKNFYFIYDNGNAGEYVIVSFPKEGSKLQGTEEFRFSISIIF